MPRLMPRDTFEKIERLIAEGLADIDIGKRLAVSPSAAAKVRHGKHSYQTGRMIGRQIQEPPTIEEIEAMCEEIRRDRLEPDPEGWMPPVVHVWPFSDF